MDERTDAKRSIESSTRHMTDIAHELSRRASPRYIGERARETALNKTNEWKEQLGTSPLALGIIGGTIGALLGRALANERRTKAYRSYELRSRPAFADEVGVRYGRATSVDYDGDSNGGIGEKIADTAHELKDKAGELKDRAGDMISGVRDRMPSVADVSQKADENPMLVALGGLALGAIAAMLLPVSRKERELLEPVKERAGSAIGSLGDKIGEGAQQAREKIAGQQDNSQRASGDVTTPGLPELTH